MYKKMIAASLAMTLSLGCVVIANTEREVDCFERLTSNVTLENQAVTYTNGKYISAKFDVKNKTGEEKKFIITIDVFDKDGNKEAGTSFKRKVKAGKTIPIKFYAELKDVVEPQVNISVQEEISTTFYVDSNANIDGTGDEKKPMQLSAVPAKIKELDSNEDYYDKDIRILLTEGDYIVNNTIKFSEFKNLSSVTISGIEEGATLLGGINVKGKDFQKVTNTQTLAMFPNEVKGNLYSLNLSDYGINLDFSDGRNVQNDPMYTVVYASDEAQTMARFPNNSDLEDAYATWKPKEKAKYPSEVWPWDGTTDTTGLFTFMSPAVADKNWKNYSEAWIRGHFMWDWDLAKGQIYSIEKKTADYYVSSNIHSSQEVMEINIDK